MSSQRESSSDPRTASIVQGISLTEQPGIGTLTIGGFLREVAARYGSAEAVVSWHCDRRVSWSYDLLLARSLEVACALVKAGAVKDTRVGILMTNRPEFLSTLFGAALAGAVPVPMSTFSTPAELEYLIKASQVAVLLFERHVVAKDFLAILCRIDPAIGASTRGRLVSERFPYLARLICLPEDTDATEDGIVHTGAIVTWNEFLSAGGSISKAIVLARAESLTPTDPGGVFFSSGTTSLPKGIVHAQRAFAIQWWRWPWVMSWPEPVRIWTGNGLFWSGQIVMMVGVALSTGGAMILQRTFEAEEALRLIECERASFMLGRPHQWAQLQTCSSWTNANLSSVKYITRGELIWGHPTVHTNWVVPMAFGTTETMTVCTGFPSEVSAERRSTSSGIPFPGNTLKIADPGTGSVVKIGEVGELCIKGPTLMLGYLGKAPEECFDPEGFFHTGDAGYVDEQGRFFWKGRMTSMIKTGGANVSPEEIDEIVALYPGVKRCQTVGIPDDLLGEQVVSCIVPNTGARLDEGAIKSFVKERLASFKVPRQVIFLTDADLATTGSEKIKFGELRALALRLARKRPGK